jgi:hypothetical protein
MEVSGYLEEIAVDIDEKRLISSLIEMTGTVMGLVEITRVGYVEMAHEVLKIGLRGLDDDMEMVGHKDKGEEMDLIDLKGMLKDFKEPLSVGIGTEDVLSVITPAGYMVTGVLILDTEIDPICTESMKKRVQRGEPMAVVNVWDSSKTLQETDCFLHEGRIIS